MRRGRDARGVRHSNSMRGLHSTRAMDAGVTGAVVAAALGHEKVSTTIESYASRDAVRRAAEADADRAVRGRFVAREAHLRPTR